MWSQTGPAAANVSVIRGSRVRIDGSTIRESGEFGFLFDHDTTVDSFTQNTVTRNESGAGRTLASTAHYLSDTCSFTGNDKDRVFVEGDNIRKGATVTWDAIDVPYFVDSNTGVTVDGHLTIEPGATLEFGQDAWMGAYDGGPGAITAVGEPDDPITFTGEQKTAGYWYGIVFDETGRTENKLHHAVVEYGGSKRFSWASEKGNVAVIRGSRLSISNTTVRNGGGFGIVTDSNSTVTSSDNTLSGNALGSTHVG